MSGVLERNSNLNCNKILFSILVICPYLLTIKIFYLDLFFWFLNFVILYFFIALHTPYFFITKYMRNLYKSIINVINTIKIRITHFVVHIWGSCHVLEVKIRITDFVVHKCNTLGFLPKPLHYILYSYITTIFFVRSFFVKERPSIIYLIGIIYMINLKFANIFFPSFSMIQYIIFNFILGLNLIGTDNVGSILSSYFLFSTNALGTNYQTLIKVAKLSRFRIIRFVSSRVIIGAIVGKTNMSSTGRAAIVVAVISGTGYLANEELNRRSTERIEANKLTFEREKFDYKKAQDARAEQMRNTQSFWNNIFGKK